MLPCTMRPSSKTMTLLYSVSSRARRCDALPPQADPRPGSVGHAFRGLTSQNCPSTRRYASGAAGLCMSTLSFVDPDEAKDCPSSRAWRKPVLPPSHRTLQNAWRSGEGRGSTPGGGRAGSANRTSSSNGRRHRGHPRRAAESPGTSSTCTVATRVGRESSAVSCRATLRSAGSMRPRPPVCALPPPPPIGRGGRAVAPAVAPAPGSGSPAALNSATMRWRSSAAARSSAGPGVDDCPPAPARSAPRRLAAVTAASTAAASPAHSICAASAPLRLGRVGAAVPAGPLVSRPFPVA
mmetsp:Transcript_37105/g.110770  ORF Transcript_37105/g.110770 Transcript_37105/m.110770 type:complete len:295 (+) Transcript_37105:1703-2587(+)